jgi:hypothetical protein
MTKFEREYYADIKKISESLETIAHSLEVLAEIRIEDIARNHTELSDEDDEDLFKDEESYFQKQDELYTDDIKAQDDEMNEKFEVPFPNVEDNK